MNLTAAITILLMLVFLAIANTIYIWAVDTVCGAIIATITAMALLAWILIFGTGFHY